MSGESSFFLFNQMVKELHSAFSMDDNLLEQKLYSTFRRITHIPSLYSRVVECAETKISELDKLAGDCFLLCKSVPDLEDCASKDQTKEVHLGFTFATEDLRRTKGGLHLLHGSGLFLFGDFSGAIDSLKKVPPEKPLHNVHFFSKLLIGLCALFLGSKEEAKLYLNLSLSCFSGYLLPTLAYYWLIEDFDRVCRFIDQKEPKDALSHLQSDPLILHFYARALYEKMLKVTPEQLEIYIKRLDSLIIPALAHFAKEKQKYYFLEPQLMEIKGLLQRQKADWETWKKKQETLALEKAVILKLKQAIQEAQGFNIDILSVVRDSLPIHRTLSWSSLDAPGTGGSPHAVEEDETGVLEEKPSAMTATPFQLSSAVTKAGDKPCRSSSLGFVEGSV